ncbi:MAG: hypothetical protein D6683_01570 [Actinomyces sp.]|nr:MAG: hypothetical protein D6683_01570 [Actinomyces sp.]
MKREHTKAGLTYTIDRYGNEHSFDVYCGATRLDHLSGCADYGLRYRLDSMDEDDVAAHLDFAKTRKAHPKAYGVPLVSLYACIVDEERYGDVTVRIVREAPGLDRKERYVFVVVRQRRDGDIVQRIVTWHRSADKDEAENAALLAATANDPDF